MNKYFICLNNIHAYMAHNPDCTGCTPHRRNSTCLYRILAITLDPVMTLNPVVTLDPVMTLNPVVTLDPVTTRLSMLGTRKS